MTKIPENQILTELPTWVHGERDENGKLKEASAPRWFNDLAPPAIGQTVHIRINSIGAGTVTGYWVEANFLGVVVVPHDPPAWYIKQNGKNAPGVSFGPEVRYDAPVSGLDRVIAEQAAYYGQTIEERGRQESALADLIELTPEPDDAALD